MTNPYKLVRRARICVAVVVAAALAAGFLLPHSCLQNVARWLMSLQIIPAVLTMAGAWILFWTAVTLLAGRIYCSTACPLGTVADLVSRLRRLTTGPRNPGYRWRPALTAVRILAAMVIIEGVALGLPDVVKYLDPAADYIILLRLGAITGWTGLAAYVAVLAVVVAMSWRHGRLMCNTVCPIGAILGAGSAVALMRFEINPDVCAHCGRCEEVCKSCCIDQKRSLVDNSRCVACFDCTAACPSGAMTWRRGRHRLQWPLLMRSAPQAPTTFSNEP